MAIRLEVGKRKAGPLSLEQGASVHVSNFELSRYRGRCEPASARRIRSCMLGETGCFSAQQETERPLRPTAGHHDVKTTLRAWNWPAGDAGSWRISVASDPELGDRLRSCSYSDLYTTFTDIRRESL